MYALLRLIRIVLSNRTPFFRVDHMPCGRLGSIGGREQAGDPFGYLRHDRIARSESAVRIEGIQALGNPMYARDSLPLNHLIPSVRVSDENLRTESDPARGVARK